MYNITMFILQLISRHVSGYLDCKTIYFVHAPFQLGAYFWRSPNDIIASRYPATNYAMACILRQVAKLNKTHDSAIRGNSQAQVHALAKEQWLPKCRRRNMQPSPTL